MTDADTTTVYVFRAGPMLKIGRSRHWEKRMKELQTGCPYELELVGLACGVDPSIERQIHIRANAYRTTGEWFKDVDAVWDILDRFGIDRIYDDDFCPACGSIGWDAIHPCDACDYGPCYGCESGFLTHAHGEKCDVCGSEA